MATRKKAESPNLRAVGKDEKPEKPEEPPAPKTITEAASKGTERELLVAMRDRIAKTVEDPKCPPRDLASLSRRLLEITKEIAGLDEEAKGRDGGSENVEDEAFDSSAV